MLRKYYWMLFLLTAAGPASAHVLPKHAEPRVGSTIEAAPAQVAVTFDAEVEPVFSVLSVHDAAKKQVDKKDSHLDAQDHHKLIVSLVPGLEAGVYHVSWQAVGRDGHHMEGHYTFTVKPKAHG